MLTLSIVTPSTGSLPAWTRKCANEGKKVKIAGSMTFTAQGLQKQQVETASKAALSSALDVHQSLITVTATESRRLLVSERRLAGTWNVAYELQVAEAKGAAVTQAMTTIKADSNAFKGSLEPALTEATGGTPITVAITAMAEATSTQVADTTTGGSTTGSGADSTPVRPATEPGS